MNSSKKNAYINYRTKHEKRQHTLQKMMAWSYMPKTDLCPYRGLMMACNLMSCTAMQCVCIYTYICIYVEFLCMKIRINVYVHIQIYEEKSYDFRYMYNDAVPKLVFMRVSYQSHIKRSPKVVFVLLCARVTWETFLCETAVFVLAKTVFDRKKRM